MRKINLTLLSLSLFCLASCNIGITSSTTGTTSSNNQGTKYLLGAYGDYVTYNGNVEEEYNKLKEVITSNNGGIFESNYEKGLLDFFDINNEVKIEIDISKSELQKLNDDHDIGNKESYRICNLDISFNDFTFHYENVGIRQKGNTSRGYILDGDEINLRHYKLAFAELFDDEYRGEIIPVSEEEAAYREERTFFGLEKIDIRWNRNQDATYLKEYYAFETYRRNGLLAPRSNPFNMVMNIDGDKQNMGIYLAVEDVNKDFIKRNILKDESKGDLYKLGWNHVSGATFSDTSSSLFGVEDQVKQGDKYIQVGYPYDLKTNKKTSTHEAIKNFINGVVNTNVNEFETFLKENMLYDYFTTYLAVSYLLGDPDDLRGNANNAYIYFTSDSNDALIIPTDNDRVLGSTGGSNPTGNFGAKVLPNSAKTGYGTNYPLFNKSVLDTGNKNVQDAYLAKIQQVINNNFNFNDFKTYYDIMYAHYNDNLVLGDKVKHDDINMSLIENNSFDSNWNLSIEVYMNTKVDTYNKFMKGETDSKEEEYIPISGIFYLRGTMNKWLATEDYILKEVNGVLTIECYFEKDAEFKVAFSDWGHQYNYSNLQDKTNFASGDSNNIKVLIAGTYIIKLVNEDTISVIKK